MNSGLIKDTNFTLTTNASTGYPVITYTSATTSNLLYNYTMLIIQECHRRLFPVVRDKNSIFLTDGTNNLTLTSTQIGSKNISDLLTNNNLSMDFITYVALSDYSGSTTTMSNLFSSFIVDVTVTSGDTGTGQHICYLPTLTNGQFIYIQISGAMQTYNLTIQDASFKLIATSLNNAIAYLPVSDGQ